jgi:hypothetical protein
MEGESAASPAGVNRALAPLYLCRFKRGWSIRYQKDQLFGSVF